MSDEFFEVMEKVNPFAFKDEKGKICIFKDYRAAYLYGIEKMYAMSMGGWLDLVLFMCTHCGFSLPDAVRFMESFERSGALTASDESDKTQLVQIDWTDYKDMQRVLTRVFNGLHWILETKFNNDMFRSALDTFCAKMGVIIG